MRRTPRTCLSLLIAAALAACSSTPPSPAAQERAVATEAAEQAAIAADSYQSAPLLSPPAPPAPPPPPPMPQRAMRMAAAGIVAPLPAAVPPPPAVDTERYAHQDDNPVRRTDEQPVSTFSIDVDTGSYSNVRRMVRAGERPPADAVRAEEFINYFDYHHPAPESPQVPFRVTTQLAPAPWNAQRQVLMIGIKGYALPKRELPPSNLVFLIDTSGSMDAPDKLPLLKQSLALLVPQLRAQDRVSIVVYAGSAGLVLPPTPGDAHAKILAGAGPAGGRRQHQRRRGHRAGLCDGAPGLHPRRQQPRAAGHRWRLQRRHGRPARAGDPGRRCAQGGRGAEHARLRPGQLQR